MAGARISGWGRALPDRVVTNVDLEASLDTSDAWITERTGIRERRIGGTTSGLAIDAGRQALVRARVDPASVNLVVLATCTPEQAMPATAATVQDALGVRGGAFDLNAVCSGFVYGLAVAAGLVATGLDRVLLIGSETLSTIVDWDDRGTAILFADGAGAVVLEAVEGPGDMLSYDLDNDGSARHLLYADLGGTMKMDGREVFRRAVRLMVESAGRALDRAGVTGDDIDLVVPHQANIRIIDSALAKLGIPMKRAAVNIDRTGNTSAASIPIALAEAADEGRLSTGDLVLMIGFGAGMSAASAVVRWSEMPISPLADLDEDLPTDPNPPDNLEHR